MTSKKTVYTEEFKIDGWIEKKLLRLDVEKSDRISSQTLGEKENSGFHRAYGRECTTVVFFLLGDLYPKLAWIRFALCQITR